MKQKYKYVFDRHSGHYIKKLNEDDSNVQTDTLQDTDKTLDSSKGSETSTMKSVESDETIQKINAKLSDIEKKYQTDLSNQQKLLDAAKVNASKKQPTGIYDPVMTDANVLSIMKKINDITKQYNNDKSNILDQKIQRLQALAQTNESYYKIPAKYKGLNESNIHTAKIYMKNLIGPDDDHIIKGMTDFKRAFKDTNLLYGKDRDGYFIIALDSEDLNNASDCLEEIGYLRDEILDTFMPQVLDRKNLVI